MYTIKNSKDLQENYKNMVMAIKEILDTENDLIANLSNISSFINIYIDRINWVGFYIKKDNELVLGPFQGGPACIRIKMGKGVCGVAAQTQEIQLVNDVTKFSGHIACDSNTKSEIVLPIIVNDEVFGVLDLDSPYISRFTELEKKYLKEVISLIEYKLNK